MTEPLYRAAINCRHEIEEDKVVLYFDRSKPGHNALNQLAGRLDAAQATAISEERSMRESCERGGELLAKDAQEYRRYAVAVRGALEELVTAEVDVLREYGSGSDYYKQRSKAAWEGALAALRTGPEISPLQGTQGEGRAARNGVNAVPGQTPDPAFPAIGNVPPLDALEEVAEALDDALGDTDITHVESDEELRDEYPVQWACARLNALIAVLRSDGHSQSTVKDAEDAARYRYLRDTAPRTILVEVCGTREKTTFTMLDPGAELDRQIDKDMFPAQRQAKEGAK